MYWKFTNRKINHVGSLFNGHFIEVKAFYALTFDKPPCINFINELDVTEACAHIRKWYGRETGKTYQHCYFEYGKEKLLFNNTIFVLTQDRMIELANGYAHILFQPENYGWANTLVQGLAAFRKAAQPQAEPRRIIGFARQTEPV